MELCTESEHLQSEFSYYSKNSDQTRGCHNTQVFRNELHTTTNFDNTSDKGHFTRI